MLKQSLTNWTIKSSDHYCVKVIGLMKDVTLIIALRPKNASYLTGNDHVNKKAKGTKKCSLKQENKLKD